MSQLQTENAKPKRGRPRDAAAQQAILTAARELLMSEGIGRLTIEGVAAKAGVGKPTIYRNWRNAHELAMAAFLADTPTRASPDKSEGARERLRTQMRRLIETFDTVRGRQITLTLAAADQDSELAKAFRTQIILKSREEGRAILTSAIANDELPTPSDIEVILDMVYAPIFYRLLVRHEPLSRAFGDSVVDAIFDGIAIRGQQ
jgi:AcrR family transcriptional regulator